VEVVLDIIKEEIIVNLIKISKVLFCCFAAVSVSVAVAKPAKSFSSAQKIQIEKIVHNYLVQHPEVLIEASNALRNKEMMKEQKKGVEGTKANATDLLRSPNSPVAGNPKGKVTLVEFFDYYCPHCRDMAKMVVALMKKDPDLRVVFKEFPIYGPPSILAVRATLAANQQGKYLAFHNNFFTLKNPLTEKYAVDLAKKEGLNVAKFKEDMNGKLAQSEIKTNYKLAKALGLVGTPAFIVTRTDLTATSHAPIIFIPGTTSEDMLLQGIEKVKDSQ